MHQDGENETQYRRHEAATFIQRQYRKRLHQTKLTAKDSRYWQDNPAIRLQYADKKHDVPMKQEPAKVVDELHDVDEQYIAALVIQNHYRNYLSNKHLGMEREQAAKTIQRHYKCYKVRSDAEFEAALQDAVNKVQIQYHSLNKTGDDEPVAATTIQRYYRQRLDKKRRDKAATLIQTKYREHLHNSKCGPAKQTLHDVVKLIQEHHISNYIEKYKKYKERKKQYGDTAATTIQRYYRQRLDKKQKDKAATLIQTKYREHLHNSNKKCQSENLAAIKIQKHYRRHLDGKKHRTDAAVRIQRKFSEDRSPDNLMIIADYSSENELLLSELAAITIQKHYHRHFDRRSQAATCIQKHYRVYDSRRQVAIENQYKKKTAAAKVIQAKYRTHLVHKHKEEVAAKTIQNQYRIHLNKKKGKNPKTIHVEHTQSVAKRRPPNKKDVKTSNIIIKKPKIVFDKEWPVSKKLNFPKSKAVPNKKISIQTSLELKKDQRKNDKNNKKDKFHLRKLNSNLTENITDGSKKVKADTPQVKQERKSIEPETEPELVVLRESTDERTPSVDIVTFVDRDTPSLLSDEEAEYNMTYPGNTYPGNTYPGNTYPGNNTSSTNNLYTTNSLQSDYNEFYNKPLEAGRAIEQRVTKRENVCKVAGGNLDSYSVQRMLKKNELVTKQKNDNNSYLHSYLQQMRIVRREPVQPAKTKNKARNQDYIRRSQPDVIIPGNLDKIARYGRNTKPEEWKTFVNTPTDVAGQKGVSRGSFYPVIPSYGRMKSSTSAETAELTEIPWPSNIG